MREAPLSPLELSSLADLIADRILAQLRSSLDADAMLDSVEAAELLGISRATLERRVADGSLRPIRVGRLRRFRRSELVAHQNAPADRPP